MRITQPHLLVQRAFKKLQKDDPKFSLRSLAKKMKISPGYLCKVLKGQKAMTKELVQRFCQQLKMDNLQQNELVQSFEKKVLRERVGDVSSLKQTVPTPQLDEYVLAPQESEWILSKWYHVSLLDLMTTEGFKEDTGWIAKRLQIIKSEAETALKVLERSGLIGRDEHGRLIKLHTRIRFSTRHSKEIIRNYNFLHMKRAMKLLELKHSQPDFQARLFSGISVAANKEKFEEARLYIHKALYKAAEILAEGPCDEVYQINLQFFPQTTNRS